MNFVLFFCFIFIIITSAPAAAIEAHIVLSDTIDVPDRTVSFESQTFNIMEIGNYKKNQNISFTIDAPDTENLFVVLYDRDRLSAWFKRYSNISGHAAGYIPSNRTGEEGTYALVVSYNRSIIGTIPVIISGYDLSVTPKSSRIASGGPLDVEVKISKNGIPVNVDNTVKVVLAKENSSIDVNATQIKTGVYEAHIETPPGLNGTYSLYSVITTDRKIYMNYPEIKGIGSGGNIYIIPPSTEKMPFISAVITMIILICTIFLRRRKL